MSTSEKRIAANRANAQKSTGPRSEAGKRRSSRNGSRHGMLADALLIDDESRARFADIVNSFHADFRPTNHTQAMLVDKMAACHWRVVRHLAIESAGIIHATRHQVDPAVTGDPATRAMLAIRSLTDNERHGDLMSRYEQRYDRQFYRALEALMKLQQLDQARRPPVPVARPDNEKSSREPSQLRIVATPHSAGEAMKRPREPTRAGGEPTESAIAPVLPVK